MNLDPLLHMLGLDENHRWPWRNHYVTSADDPDLAPLIAAGLVEETRAPKFRADGDRVYRATDEGRRVAIAEIGRRTPKLTRSQKRYRQWLDVADAVGVRFGEWLQLGGYKPGFWS